MVDNPASIGEWGPHKIPNPNFFDDLEPAVKHLNNIGGVGIELWTMTEDILFNNIYVGHSIDNAKALATETYNQLLHPLEDPISHIHGKIAHLTLAWEDPLSAIQTHPETGLGLAGVVFTLFSMLAVLFSLIGSQQRKPIAKANNTDTFTPDDKQKTDSTPVAPAGGEKDKSTAKRRK
ncbi:Calreticulin-domain-containing protein [Suillus weaverae]|nr:Calreticulin-domain-containing protein [Suillus weaverae]